MTMGEEEHGQVVTNREWWTLVTVCLGTTAPSDRSA
jgi:hypothetical protein